MVDGGWWVRGEGKVACADDRRWGRSRGWIGAYGILEEEDFTWEW